MDGKAVHSNTAYKTETSYSKKLTDYVLLLKHQMLILKTNILNIKLQKTYIIKGREI